MRLYQVFLFFLVFSINYCSYGQDPAKYETFLDENNKPIDIVTYKKKCKARVLYCDGIQIDSLAIYRIKQRYYFGKLDSIKQIQLFALLKSRTNLNINPSETIVISHRNNLNGFEATKNLRTNKIIVLKKPFYYEPYTKKRHLSLEQRFDSDQKKCLKGLKRENIFPIYMFKKNDGYRYKPKHYSWTQSAINIPAIFNFSEKVKDSASVIFLRPNGDYFISRQVLPLTFIKKLLKLDSWIKPEEDLYNSIKLNSGDGIGIFSNIWRNKNYSRQYTNVNKYKSSNIVKYKNHSPNKLKNYPNTITTCFK